MSPLRGLGTVLLQLIQICEMMAPSWMKVTLTPRRTNQASEKLPNFPESQSQPDSNQAISLGWSDSKVH